ncbi:MULTISPECIES: DUF1292 domain-containing protein [Paenibacillus]|uniref:DUF1292 domain-containing protein n=1 Tax=Paenibacillus chitinolyticus TaxID=79263 RepID=A0A410X1U4_9BACL|nr:MULTISPECIES: DUF1292 domain-containing protein [Paenibacillus]EGL15014.1 hypothetical protein HMPREF9413_5544 [Paenibacillus sp. HGF7]EPD90420.1 hypothetical protein HMPREF1207_01206 [Paenibacillus sp. HGH0039]MBV6712453.1 DUF1292 domain-containing protein [Paenibacillus chitinolyticus]MCY9592674.1 DUF1292 domain-containing protein [Paenibacillus chitinolyticus]MCY9594723.1 DUF1292 domain-containing protein [Paenibacillus chitinolyticus]
MSVKQTNELRSSFGDDIILFDEQDESTVFRILTEILHEDRHYAVLQSEEMKKEGEVSVFRVSRDSEGTLELETIEDDEEWETVSELYDELTFPEHDEP